MWFIAVRMIYVSTHHPPHLSLSLSLCLCVCAGKLCFIVLRQQYHTVQAVVAVSETVSKQMTKFATE